MGAVTPAHPRNLKSRALTVTGIVVWLSLVATGMIALSDYSTRPCEPGQVATQWPATTALKLSATKPTVVMLLHPKCVCSKASISELARAFPDGTRRVEFKALFYQPAGRDEDWVRTNHWKRLTTLDQEAPVVDREGLEAKRFGVQTSGHVLVYTPAGQLVFSGGISNGRGHEGDNPGRQALVAAVNGSETSQRDFAVFGCPINHLPAGSDLANQEVLDD